MLRENLWWSAPREGDQAWLSPPFLAIVLPHTTRPSNPSRRKGWDVKRGGCMICGEGGREKFREVGCMIGGWVVGRSWGSLKKVAIKEAGSTLGKGWVTSTEVGLVWPHTAVNLQKRNISLNLLFRLWVMCSLLIFLSLILKDRVFLEKMLKREYPEPNLVGMSSPTREAALSLSLKHIYHTCAPVEIYQKHFANVRKKLISINVQKQNISYVLD